MARILIELYSAKTPENLISLLKGNYDRICFLSFPEKASPSEKDKKNLRNVIFQIVGFYPEFYSVEKRSIDRVLALFSTLLEENNTLEIDLTGGNEIFAAAAGIFLERHREKKVLLHQYDVKTDKKHFSYPHFAKEESFFPHYLTSDQILTLGGSTPLVSPSFSFSVGVLRQEILRLWNLVKQNPKEWNRFCSLSADSEGGKSTLTQKYLGDKDSHLHAYRIIAEKLKQSGIISDEKKSVLRGRSYMDFSLNVPKEALFLYEKAGNILEMYAALCAYDAGIFHDIRVGVKLDWNGTVHPPHIPDPRNEIDLILMHENLPILASCKNTPPQNEHLYEIMIMTKHYGGHYATPMLLTSGRSSPTVRQRAKEMGVLLIDGIRYLTPKQFSEKFEKHFPQ